MQGVCVKGLWDREQRSQYSECLRSEVEYKAEPGQRALEVGYKAAVG